MQQLITRYQPMRPRDGIGTAPIWLTVPEAGALIGLAPQESYRRARLGQMPGVVRMGRSLSVLRSVFLRELGLTEADLIVDQVERS